MVSVTAAGLSSAGALGVDISQGVNGIIETYGLPGLVIVGLGLAVRSIFNRYVLTVDARAQETKEVVGAMERNTQALNSLGELIKERLK